MTRQHRQGSDDSERRRPQVLAKHIQKSAAVISVDETAAIAAGLSDITSIRPTSYSPRAILSAIGRSDSTSRSMARTGSVANSAVPSDKSHIPTTSSGLRGPAQNRSKRLTASPRLQKNRFLEQKHSLAWLLVLPRLQGKQLEADLGRGLAPSKQPVYRTHIQLGRKPIVEPFFVEHQLHLRIDFDFSTAARRKKRMIFSRSSGCASCSATVHTEVSRLPSSNVTTISTG